MKKHIIIIAGFCAAVLTLASCSDEFLEVKNPTGEPLEEYYTTEETLNEALTSAYAPLSTNNSWSIYILLYSH